MIYLKIYDSTGTIAAAETLAAPIYVWLQPRNGRVLRCVEPVAQGIVSADGTVIYQLEGREILPNTSGTAAVITTAEYQELLATLDQTDTEDTAPEIPEGTEEENIMTRAELTAKVLALEEELAAAKILLGVK